MKFEEIKEGMLISYGKALYSVEAYFPASALLDEHWDVVSMDSDISLALVKGDELIPKFSIFDIDDMVMDQ